MAREIDTIGARTAVENAALESDDNERLVLSDLINRVLDKGVVISGHVTISVADIDLVALDLRLLIASFDKAIARGEGVDVSSSR